MVYRAHPFTRALEGIAKAGFKYVAPGRSHMGKDVFVGGMPAAARAELKRQMSDQGLQPVLSLGGFNAELTSPGGPAKYAEEIDLCAEFGIPAIVGGGPWYFQKWPNLPKRDSEFQKEAAAFYTVLEKLLPHAASRKVIITLKPHTGITARAKDCLAVVKRLPSDWLKICWDAGNVSFYEGIYPDPDLPDVAPHVAAVCLKDHRGGRGEVDFPIPGTGQTDHEGMMRTLFQAGFHGPMAIEKLEGRDNPGRMPVELIDERAATAYKLLAGMMERTATAR
jgi:sugar phosphate isomerase/epimerase